MNALTTLDVEQLAETWSHAWRRQADRALREGLVCQSEACQLRAAAVEEFAAALIQSTVREKVSA